jgi:hypothetical protein
MSRTVYTPTSRWAEETGAKQASGHHQDISVAGRLAHNGLAYSPYGSTMGSAHALLGLHTVARPIKTERLVHPNVHLLACHE